MTKKILSNCILCGNPINKKSIEHVIPENIFGKLKSSNLLCRNCNNRLGTELDWVLQKRFQLILLGLNLCGVHKNKKTRADVSFKGKKYVFTKHGPRKKHPTVIKEGNKITWEFDNEKMARKQLKKYKKKNPNVDVNEMIDTAEREKINFDEPFKFVADAPTEETWRVCAKIGYEFVFLANPSYSPAIEKFKDLILGKIPLEEYPICLFYPNYNPIDFDRDSIYHLIILEARKEDKLIIVYLEIFSCFKVVMLIEDDYIGENFQKGYSQNLMTMERDYFNPAEVIPISKGKIIELTQNCQTNKYIYTYIENFKKSSFKARLFPLKELILELIKKLKTEKYANKIEKYQYILSELSKEFKRLGLNLSILEEISEDHLEDELLEKIRKLIDYSLSCFLKLEMNVDIFQNLVDLI